MLGIARAADEQPLFPIYTHELIERFLTFDGVDEHRFRGIFRSLLESGDFFVYEVDRTIVGFCKATRLPAGRTMLRISDRSRSRPNFTVAAMRRRC